MAKTTKKKTVAAAPKTEAATPSKSAAADAPKSTDTTATADSSKAESSDTSGGAPKGYSRGEGQKPVTQAYKDNWNAIFGKKKKR